MSVANAPRSHAAVLLLAASLALPGCDKLTGGGDEKAAEDAAKAKAAADEEAKKKAEEEEAKKKAAAEDEAKKKAAADEEAKKKAAADEEAKKKAAEDEAKKKAEEDAKKPVLLSDIAISTGGMFGSGGGSLKVEAKAKFNEAIKTGTFVHIKAVCKKDARLFADVSQLGLTDYSKQLHQFAAGETTSMTGNVFTQGVETAMSPCQFDYRLGSGFGGVSVLLAQSCYDGTTKVGPCDPPVVAAAMSGSSLPVDVADVVVKPEAGYGSPGVNVSAVLQINKPLDDQAQLVVKTTCTAGTQKLVDVQQPYIGAGPFRYEAGESLVRPLRMFWNPVFAFTESPKVCDVTHILRTSKSGAWGEYESTVLKRSCFKDEKVTDGLCETPAAAPPPPVTLTAAAVTVDGVKVELAAPYGGGAGQFMVKVQADITMKAPVDQNGSIDAHLTCKVGSAQRQEKTWVNGVDLHYLDVGETTRISGQGFTSEALAGDPKSCEVRFTVGSRTGATATPEELGKWCMKKGKIKPGKC
jgi:hypothetical protein